MSRGGRSEFNTSVIRDEEVKASIQKEIDLRNELNTLRDSLRDLQDEKDKCIRAFQPKQDKFNSSLEEEFDKLIKEKNNYHSQMDKLKVKQHERQKVLDDFRSLALEIEPLRREINDKEMKYREVAASVKELEEKRDNATKTLKFQSQSDADEEITKIEREINAATKKGDEKLLRALTKQKNAAEKAKKEVIASYNIDDRLLAARKKEEALKEEIASKKKIKDEKEQRRSDLKDDLDKDKPKKAAHSDPNEEGGEKKKDEFKILLEKVKVINAKLDANRAKKKDNKPKNTELDEVNKKLDEQKKKRSQILDELDGMKNTVPQARVSFKEEFRGDLLGKGGATVNQLQEDFGVSIRADGNVLVIAGGQDDVDSCAEAVKNILETVEANRQQLEIPFDMKLAPQFIGSQGSNIQRLQKASGAEVKMDKENGKIRVTGSNENIENAKSMIEEFIANNASAELRFDHSLREVVIGKGGSTIRQYESESGCKRLHVDRDRCVISMQGTKEAVEKAKALYTDLIEGMTSNAFTMRADDRMTGLVIGPKGQTINEIQETTKAFVECRNGNITIRGAKDAVMNARKMIEDITRREEIKIPFESFMYSMLTERPWYQPEDDDEGNRGQGEEGESPLENIRTVCGVDQCSAIRSESRIVVRGKQTNVNQARTMIDELLRSNRPDVVRISYPDFAFSSIIKRGADRNNMLDRIRMKIPALVHCDVVKEKKVIEVAGPTEAVAEASEEVKAFVEKAKANSKQIVVPGKATRFVIGSGGQTINELQTKHKVNLNLDKDNNNTLTIWSNDGDMEKVEACAAAVQEIITNSK